MAEARAFAWDIVRAQTSNKPFEHLTDESSHVMRSTELEVIETIDSEIGLILVRHNHSGIESVYYAINGTSADNMRAFERPAGRL